MVILRGSMLGRRKDGSSCRARAGRWLLRRPASSGRFRGLARADSAVARRAEERREALGVRWFPGSTSASCRRVLTPPRLS